MVQATGFICVLANQSTNYSETYCKSSMIMSADDDAPVTFIFFNWILKVIRIICIPFNFYNQAHLPDSPH